MPAAALQGVQDEMAATVSRMHTLAVRRIQMNTGGGRTYKRGGRTHIASLPYQYPNADTGALVRSLGWYASGLSAYFFAGIRYAKYLEFGTSRMSPRPFMRPTFKEIAPQYRVRVRKAVKDAMRAFYGR